MKLPFRFSRQAFLRLVLGLGFVAVGARLSWIHWYRREALAAEGFELTRLNFVRWPHRGEIQDRNGNILAVSEPVVRLCADPSAIRHRAGELAALMAPILGLSPAYLEDRFRLRIIRFDREKRMVFDQRVILKPHVSLREWTQIQERLQAVRFADEAKPLGRPENQFLKALRKKALFAEADEVRRYPYGPSMAHVVGHVSAGEEGYGQTGQAGMELQLEKVVRGSKGWLKTEKDHQGKELREFRGEDLERINGLNVKLTIDAAMQTIVYEELGGLIRRHTPAGVACIVVEPATGAVRAWVSLSSYDPAHPGAAVPGAIYDRVVRESFEPGSVFKLVVVAAGLNEGRFSMDRVFFCENGFYKHPGGSLRDAHPHGDLSAEDVLVKSSNIGVAKMGQELGPELLHRYIRKFGFGEKSGIPLPWESAGVVNQPANWSSIALTRIPMGHEIGVTAVQLAMAYSCLGNQGWLMVPMLVETIEDDRGRQVFQGFPQPRRNVLSPSVCRILLNALERVPTKEGTAPAAALGEHRLAAKTGTAIKWKDGRYLEGRYVCSMAGLFPASSPRLCLVMVVDDPDPARGYYAGSVCGPYLKRMGERLASLLRLPPDKLIANPTQLAAIR